MPLAQVICVNEPQVPENNWIYEVQILAPTLLKVIVGKGDVAVNEYHTSAPGVPEHVLDTEGLEIVAPAKVPAVFTHDEPGVMLMAPEQLSLAGALLAAGSVTQILKVKATPVDEYTLM